MTDHPECPFGTCEVPVPHSHPMLGEGLFGPRPVRAASTSSAPLGMQSFGQIATTVDGPLECACGAQWTGSLITPLRAGEGRRKRKCDACCERDEAETMRRFKANFPDRDTLEPLDVSAVRLPYRDDDGGL